MLRNFFALVLCIQCILSLMGCTDPKASTDNGIQISDSESLNNNTTLPEAAKETLNTFTHAMQSGDWDIASRHVASSFVMSNAIQSQAPDGIIKNIMKSSVIDIQTVKKSDKDHYLITMKIEALDYRALINSLPNNIASKEEARDKMLELAPNTHRTTFDAQLNLLADTSGNFYVEPDISFINAMTGGFYDVYTEIVKEVLKQ